MDALTVGASLASAAYDGVAPEALAERLGVPRVVALAETTSTLDVAHALAEADTSSGTLVLADRQTAGRGRHGRVWSSPSGTGVWLTLVERAVDPAALPVLPIRLGLVAARALDPYATTPVSLKWPNDLWLGERKLAGVLVEARWQAERLAWVAIGVGVNVVAPPDVERSAGLRAAVRRLDVLASLVPALRAAVRARGTLDDAELAEYARRDVARGRRCEAPVVGIVVGLRDDGALLVETAAGVQALTQGSLTFAERSA